MFYAHSHPELAPEDWHKLEDHLLVVAKTASRFASLFRGQHWGEAVGLLHDIGKCQKAFQDYLLKTVGNMQSGPSGIEHSIAGARLAAENDPHLGKILAYAIAGHHAGLPDGRSDGPSLEKRLEKQIPACAADLAKRLKAEVPAYLPFQPNPDRFGAQLCLFIRMIFSCLVDADRLDTEAYMSPDRFQLRGQNIELSELVARFFPKLNTLKANAVPSHVNNLRRKVLDECLVAADQRPGLFSLTVPTGGGKTLSSLAFALRHAQKYDLQRIIYVMPYMSIIEQNAEVFRLFLCDDAVLEHHSSFDFDSEKNAENPENRWAKLAAENWAAPLIATTSVQFFESLFSARPGKCRKLHNIAKSVIILDEAQMLPRHLLLPCLEVLRELTDHYGVSLLLCTATQPALSKRDDFIMGLQGVREIVSDTELLHSQLKRVQVKNLGVFPDKDLVRNLQKIDQVLCITNTRGHARKIYQALSVKAESVYHLSASMCPVHRRKKLREIMEAIRLNKPCRVISTQLVEAGVDVDFPVVYRAATGIDSVAQAAGRCDREGHLTEKFGTAAGQVYVFYPENGLPPGHFRITADTAEEVLRHHEDPLAPEAVDMYFRHLFWKAGDELDKKKILRKMGEDAERGNIPFREISFLFKIIEEEKDSIVIPLDQEAKEMVHSLKLGANPRKILRRLQPYTVQIHSRWLNNLIDHGAVETVAGVVPVLRNMDIYSPDLGLCPEDPGFRNAENLII